MSITKEDFFNNFHELMRLNASIPNNLIGRLVVQYINGQRIGPDDLVRIVEGIQQGNKEQLNRRRDLETYLERTLIEIEDNRTDRRNWEYIYGFGDDGVDVSEIEDNMEEKIHELLEVLRKNPQEFAEFFGLMTPGQQMTLASLERQGIRTAAATATTPEKRKRLLPELFREEISPYVGKKPTGGRYRSKKMKSMRRKNKKTKKKTHKKK